MIAPRKQHAILVDAGYLFAQAAEDLFGPNVRRDALRLDERAAALALEAKAAEIFGADSSLLRVYWYDAAPREGRMNESHQRLALLPNMKIRLGTLNSNGQQKGVDALICKDLFELSANGAASDILLVSGDEDLRVFVEMAQSHGSRVSVLSVGDPKDSVSRLLEMESDGLYRLPVRDAAAFVSLANGSAASSPAPRAQKSASKKARPAPKKPAPAPHPSPAPQTPAAAAQHPPRPAHQHGAPKKASGSKSRKPHHGKPSPQGKPHSGSQPAQKPERSRRRPRPASPKPAPDAQ